MKIAVGTKNKAKLESVSMAIAILKSKTKGLNDTLLAHEVEIIGCEVPSGVPMQPMNENETLQGAINRARLALEKVPDAEFGLGIESGVSR